jgi:hypothetical protein
MTPNHTFAAGRGQQHLEHRVVQHGVQVRSACAPGAQLRALQRLIRIRQQLQQAQRHLHRNELPPVLPVVLRRIMRAQVYQELQHNAHQ